MADAAVNPFPIVGVGASAGGLDALTQLLSALPANPGLAVVVIQHLDPRHESQLERICCKHAPDAAHGGRHATHIGAETGSPTEHRST